MFSIKSGLSIEATLSDLYGYRHVVLFGGARSGLRAVFQALGMEGKPVLIPSNVCSALLASVVGAKARTVAVPVRPTNGMVAAASFRDAAAAETTTGVLMPTHLYGCHQPYGDLKNLGWVIVENDTLCAATIRDGQRRAIGDALVVSFNDVKTIEAGGGGAVLTDDTALAAELTAIAGGWRYATDADRQMEDHLMLARRHLRALGRTPISEGLFDLDLGLTALALTPSHRPAIEAAIIKAPGMLAKKKHRLEMWMRALEPLSTAFCPVENKVVVPWRLTLALRDPEHRVGLVNALRLAGVDAGTNYPPLAREFPSYLPRQEAAELWASRVLNLWLTDRYDAAQITASVDVMRRYFDA